MSILVRTDLPARMVQGAAVAVLMTVVNVAVQSAQGVNSLPFALKLLLLGVSAGAGVVGGAVYFATEPWRVRGGWRKTGVNVATILVACAVAVALLASAGWAGLLGAS
jgi:hypothetical protein